MEFQVDQQLVGELTALLAVYAIEVVFFAVIYWRIYRRDASSFVFNADILERHRSAFHDSAKDRTASLERRCIALGRLASHFDNGSVILSDSSSLGTAGRRGVIGELEFEARIEVALGGLDCYELFLLLIKDESGTHLIDIKEHMERLPKDSKEMGELVSRVLESQSRQLKELRDRLAASLKSNRHCFRFLDFVYFSFISQTTVGYGDILPNRTRVRMYVVAQVLFAYFLFVVVLNALITANNT